ncbi:MAG: hypothetical protein Q9217_006200 [Psora testacea]
MAKLGEIYYLIGWTPKSPPPEVSVSPSPKPPASDEDVQMVAADEAPNIIPFENHPQDLLPAAILKAYPNGPPVRDAQQSAAFETRKHEILRTMTPQEMQKRYKELAGEIAEKLEENERKDEEVREEIDKLTKSRDLEIKVWERLKAADKRKDQEA